MQPPDRAHEFRSRSGAYRWHSPCVILSNTHTIPAVRSGGEERAMSKFLLVSYYFPPIGGAGAQRPLKFARYLLDQRAYRDCPDGFGPYRRTLDSGRSNAQRRHPAGGRSGPRSWPRARSTDYDRKPLAASGCEFQTCGSAGGRLALRLPGLASAASTPSTRSCLHTRRLNRVALSRNSLESDGSPTSGIRGRWMRWCCIRRGFIAGWRLVGCVSC